MLGIPGEKKCEVCDCLFVNKVDTETNRCSGCQDAGPEAAGVHEKIIYRDIRRSDIEAKLNAILTKLDVIIKLHGEDKKPREYSKKCETCGSVFVSEQPATRYCDSCKEAVKN